MGCAYLLEPGKEGELYIDLFRDCLDNEIRGLGSVFHLRFKFYPAKRLIHLFGCKLCNLYCLEQIMPNPFLGGFQKIVGNIVDDDVETAHSSNFCNPVAHSSETYYCNVR